MSIFMDHPGCIHPSMPPPFVSVAESTPVVWPCEPRSNRKGTEGINQTGFAVGRQVSTLSTSIDMHCRTNMYSRKLSGLQKQLFRDNQRQFVIRGIDFLQTLQLHETTFIGTFPYDQPQESVQFVERFDISTKTLSFTNGR